MKINSMRGPLDTSELGVTLMHEHLATICRDMKVCFDDWFDEEDAIKKFKAEMDKAKKYGLSTYVEASPITLGRDIFLLIKAAEEADINILCCTGLYHTQDPWFNDVDPNILASYYIRELTEGIQGTDKKAAYVKCATDTLHGKSPANKGMVQAAAIAAKETGVPVYTHENNGTNNEEFGIYQQSVLMEEGVEPHKICIGHGMGMAGANIDYVRTILNKGSYVACDQMGYASPEYYAPVLAQLCKEGYSRQIFLSHDKNVVSDFNVAVTSQRRADDNIFAGGGYTIIFEKLLPLLLENGVTQEQIDDMMINNPRRYFEGVDPCSR